MKKINPWVATIITVAALGGIAGYFIAKSRKSTCTKGKCSD